MHWLQPRSYGAPALFLLMGAFAVVLAWNTANLAQMAMANIRFLGAYGTMAIIDGGIMQLLEITVRGVVSLAAYLGFKACEVELVHRWRSWTQGK